MFQAWFAILYKPGVLPFKTKVESFPQPVEDNNFELTSLGG